jgi:hypothetical protein
MMLMTVMSPQSISGSTLSVREFLIGFGKSEGYWAQTLKGFSHCFVGEIVCDGQALILFEPLFKEAVLDVMLRPFAFDEHLVMIRMKVKSKNKNRLIKPTFQTCSTLIQYVAGINLGTITPQGLYDALTLSDAEWLKSKGILEVTEWVA